MKLIIEPMVPQPDEPSPGVWRWRGKLMAKETLRQHLPLHAPHRLDDPLKGGVVERVEARQGRHVTYDDMRAAGMENPERGKVLGEPANVGPWEYEWDRKHPDRPWDLDDWYWLFWLRED